MAFLVWNDERNMICRTTTLRRCICVLAIAALPSTSSAQRLADARIAPTPTAISSPPLAFVVDRALADAPESRYDCVAPRMAGAVIFGAVLGGVFAKLSTAANNSSQARKVFLECFGFGIVAGAVMSIECFRRPVS